MPRPRVLVTGFTPFPGAAENPTESLVARLNANPPLIEGMGAFRAEVLPVDYAEVGPRLSEIGRAFRPDVAVHFGLAQEARGFRLERVARNRFAADRPDNSGAVMPAGPICDGAATFPSTLPLETIRDVLEARGFPTELSDDAGGYLCNMVFLLSRAHACTGFAPTISGFVHVPPTCGHGSLLTEDDLVDGVVEIVRACTGAWRID
jgi:pyroglutamyl-peptidase